MIDKFIDELKRIAVNVKEVQQVAQGDILNYVNKSVVYPYVNIDIVSSSVRNNLIYHNIRFYVMDRNVNYLTSYNKTELILDSILKESDLQTYAYTAIPFVLNYKDQITGFYCDVEIPEVVLTGQNWIC